MPTTQRVQSSSGVQFQSNTATTKVAVMPPRNKLQKVRLCQLPGSGVGQMRNGGAVIVRSSSRFSVTPRQDRGEDHVKSKSIMARGQKTNSLCRFATAR